jgi:hypothetical protein
MYIYTFIWGPILYLSWLFSHYLSLNYNLLTRGMNNNVMQMQLELNIEKKWDINIENLVVNMVLKKRVQKK